MLPWHCLQDCPSIASRQRCHCIASGVVGTSRSQIFQLACCHSGRCKADSGFEVMLLRGPIEAQPPLLSIGLLLLMQSADVCLEKPHAPD